MSRVLTLHHRGTGYRINRISLPIHQLSRITVDRYYVQYPKTPISIWKRGWQELLELDFDDLGWPTESEVLHAGQRQRPQSSYMLSPRIPLARLMWRTRDGRWHYGDWTAADLKSIADRNNSRPGNHIRYHVQDYT
jgi:hypothetical protein